MTISNFTKFVVLLALLLTASNFVHAQNKVCSVTTYFVDLEAKASTSRFLVGKFDLQLDDENDDITRFFRHEESGVNVAVGVALVKGIFDDEPVRIRVALSFTAKPDDNFDSLAGVEAETIYDKSWRQLSVSDNVKVANRIYTFTFGCERKNKKRAGK